MTWLMISAPSYPLFLSLPSPSLSRPFSRPASATCVCVCVCVRARVCTHSLRTMKELDGVRGEASAMAADKEALSHELALARSDLRETREVLAKV